jgi:hypothetical protein
MSFKPSHYPVEVFPTPIIEESIEGDGAGITEKSLRWLFEPGWFNAIDRTSARVDASISGPSLSKRAS